MLREQVVKLAEERTVLRDRLKYLEAQLARLCEWGDRIVHPLDESVSGI